jgi:hypothetical protein
VPAALLDQGAGGAAEHGQRQPGGDPAVPVPAGRGSAPLPGQDGHRGEDGGAELEGAQRRRGRWCGDGQRQRDSGEPRGPAPGGDQADQHGQRDGERLQEGERRLGRRVRGDRAQDHQHGDDAEAGGSAAQPRVARRPGLHVQRGGGGQARQPGGGERDRQPCAVDQRRRQQHDDGPQAGEQPALRAAWRGRLRGQGPLRTHGRARHQHRPPVLHVVSGSPAEPCHARQHDRGKTDD